MRVPLDVPVRITNAGTEYSSRKEAREGRHFGERETTPSKIGGEVCQVVFLRDKKRDAFFCSGPKSRETLPSIPEVFLGRDE